MSAKENKAIVRRLFDKFYNAGDVDVADQLFATDAVIHGPATGDRGVSAGIVTIDEVIKLRSSWVVIHPEESGSRNPRIGSGRIALPAGNHENVEIRIDLERATPVLYAEIHDDLGSPREFEVLDRPAKPSVLVSFTVTLP